MSRWPEGYVSKRKCQCGARKDFYAAMCRRCHVPSKPLAGRTGANHPAWRGGARIDEDGYTKTYDPAHPFPRRGGYVFEHVRVMELHLGRRMVGGEVVHHVNHDKTDNRIENLRVMSAGEHSRYHRLHEAMEGRGWHA
jgi:hypothetical protein